MRLHLCQPFLLVLLIGLTWSCQSKKNNEAATVSEPAATGTPTYPYLSNTDVSILYSQADHIDIIFYDLPISVSQDDAASVKNTVLYISPASPIITAQCKPLGRLSWMSKGAIVREADIFMAEGCQYLLFIENGKPVAANAMTQGAIDFFKNIISQVEQRSK